MRSVGNFSGSGRSPTSTAAKQTAAVAAPHLYPGDIRVTREQQSGLCWAVLVAVSLVPMSVSPCNCLHSFIPVYSRPCPPSRPLPNRKSLLSSKPRYSPRWSPSLPRTRPRWRRKRTARSRCPSPTRSRSGGRRLLAVVCIPLYSWTLYIFVNCAFYFLTYTIVSRKSSDRNKIWFRDFSRNIGFGVP